MGRVQRCLHVPGELLQRRRSGEETKGNPLKTRSARLRSLSHHLSTAPGESQRSHTVSHSQIPFHSCPQSMQRVRSSVQTRALSACHASCTNPIRCCRPLQSSSGVPGPVARDTTPDPTRLCSGASFTSELELQNVMSEPVSYPYTRLGVSFS